MTWTPLSYDMESMVHGAKPRLENDIRNGGTSVSLLDFSGGVKKHQEGPPTGYQPIDLKDVFQGEAGDRFDPDPVMEVGLLEGSFLHRDNMQIKNKKLLHSAGKPGIFISKNTIQKMDKSDHN